jgi:hypothetical protein
MSVDWDTADKVDVATGSYLSWASKPGQTVTGLVLNYTDDGGTNANGDPCPQLNIELTEPAYSVNRDGDRTDYEIGHQITLNTGQVRLKNQVKKLAPTPDDLIKIDYVGLVQGSRGKIKDFQVRVLRGGATF